MQSKYDIRKDTKEYKRLLKKIKIFMKFRNYRKKEKKEKEGEINITAVSTRTNETVFLQLVTKSDLKSGKIGVAQIRNLQKIFEKKDFEKKIIITSGNFTWSAKKEARIMGIECLPGELLPSFNLFEHELVPKHEILPKEEKAELLRKYRIKPYQMPHIKMADPVIRLIGAKRGDIIKITRKSQTAGRSVVYRYVV
jgi:DNA-directed RNA polymerase subunit H